MTILIALFVVLEILAFAMLFVALRELRKNISVFSPATYRLHRQFILLLATQVCVSSKLQKYFQIFTPLFFFSMPVLVNLICAKYHILAPMWLDQLGAFLTAIYGTMNALLTVLFIQPYRTHAYAHLVAPWLVPMRRLFCYWEDAGGDARTSEPTATTNLE